MKIKFNKHIGLLIGIIPIISQLTTPGFVSAQQYEVSKEAVVTVGNPSTGCPSGWPMAHGYVSQGPEGAASHYNNDPEQGIDIGGNTRGTPTYATFIGEVTQASDLGDGYGRAVLIKANCNGNDFFARWAHLNSIDGAIRVGVTTSPGQLLGTIDNTGHSFGDHLHYGFTVLPMQTPYIPQNLLSIDCDEPNPPCGVSW